MFTNTRSIQQLAFKSWSDELEVIEAIRSMELQFSRYLKTKKPSNFVTEIEDAHCITTYTQLLREKMWGVAMEGITMPPQQEQTRLYPWEEIGKEHTRRAILYTEQDHTCLHKQTSRGRHAPYFGSLTRLRAKRAALQVVEVGSVVSSIKQLMELHGWVKGNLSLTNLIEVLIAEKTTLSIEELQKYTQKVYSDSLTHRLRCPALRKGGMANQNLNHSSFYAITSDTALEYCKGGINYTICFQGCFLYGLSVLAHYTEMNLNQPKQMGLLFSCTHCTWVLPPESFSLETVHYKGIPLKDPMVEFHHKNIYERYPLHSQVSEDISYAVQMARKFAAWIVNRRMIDKITSLDNRAMEENLTLSFVNIAEFSRLQLPIFLKSFLFYCAVFDPLFFAKQLDYYNEILESVSKNPYDVLLDNLRRCGHLRSLCSLQEGPSQHKYTAAEMRSLLYNVLTSFCEDMKVILSTAYILTQEDHLHTVIRAMQIWLHVNELPCYITLSMSKDQLDSAIEQHYSDYPSLYPVVTLSEEETTHLIRLQPIKPTTQSTGSIIPLPPYAPTISDIRESLDGSKCFWVVDENPTSSSLAFLSRNENFLDLVKERHLITLEDPEGLCYSILSHTWIFKEGYPHWTSNEDWERDPYAINSDKCSISWDKDSYYCNGPKKHIKVYQKSLIVIPYPTQITWEEEEDV